MAALDRSVEGRRTTADKLHGDIIASDLVRDDSQQVQRIGVARLDRKNLSVDRVRLRQSPGLVMLNREFKRLRDGHGEEWELDEPEPAGLREHCKVSLTRCYPPSGVSTDPLLASCSSSMAMSPYFDSTLL